MEIELLDDRALERSWVVANRDMNRQRGLAGVNSYARELGFDPLAVLRDVLARASGQPARPSCPAAWLDLARHASGDAAMGDDQANSCHGQGGPGRFGYSTIIQDRVRGLGPDGAGRTTDGGDQRMRAEEPSSTIVSLDDLRRRRGEILTAATRHGIRNVRVFGSVARGQATPASDIDFLVDLEPDRSLLDLAGLLVDLEDLLGRRVDVITAPGLKVRMRSRVLGEAVPL